jgi:hypothetical protein
VTADAHPEGLLGPRGYRSRLEWATPGQARARAAELVAALRGDRTEIVRNPHREHDWAKAAVRSPRLIAAVQDVLGPAVAVENTFLVAKWPGSPFLVPWHQDGTDARIELDPLRSVSAWLAVTEATTANGCLEVVHGSQRLGYLPVEKEPDQGAACGRADQASGFTAEVAATLPLRAGGAVIGSRLPGSGLPQRVRRGFVMLTAVSTWVPARDPAVAAQGRSVRQQADWRMGAPSQRQWTRR